MAKADNHCPECGVFVKPENLPSHLRKAHGKEEAAARIERRSPSTRRRSGLRAPPMWIVVAVVLAVVLASGAYLAFRGSTSPTQVTPLTEMCVQHEIIPNGPNYHYHAQLAITILGNPHAIPAGIGIVSNACYRPLHTHSDDVAGRIHIELPEPRAVYLKDFFAIWGQPFSQTRILAYVADATREITMSVNGVPSSSYENLILVDNQNILIEYRTR